MATYTPNEQLKQIVNTQYSQLNATTHNTFYSFFTVPSTEYWKVRFESFSSKKDNNEIDTLTLYIRRPTSPNVITIDFEVDSFSNAFVPIGDYASIGFLNREDFLHPGWQVGFKFTNPDSSLDAYLDLTIFKYAIF